MNIEGTICYRAHGAGLVFGGKEVVLHSPPSAVSRITDTHVVATQKQPWSLSPAVKDEQYAVSFQSPRRFEVRQMHVLRCRGHGIFWGELQLGSLSDIFVNANDGVGLHVQSHDPMNIPKVFEAQVSLNGNRKSQLRLEAG